MRIPHVDGKPHHAKNNDRDNYAVSSMQIGLVIDIAFRVKVNG